MNRPLVVQEIVFDLATNTCLPTKLTGYGFYGRQVDFDMGVSPQMLFKFMHPEDVDSFMEFLEDSLTLAPAELLGVRIRFLHTCGEYVEAAIVSRLESTIDGDRARFVRTTVTWTPPMGVEPDLPTSTTAACTSA